MMGENDFSRLELSLPAARKNYRYFRSLLRPSTKLLVLVKANAYGHGAVEFASMMQAEGADYLAVALPVEGIELRRAGISLPVLVLTAGTDFFPEIIDYRLEPGIPNLYTLKALCDTLDSPRAAADPNRPEVGDVRLSWLVVPHGEVTVVGMDSRIEIWDKAAFAAFMEQQKQASVKEALELLRL